MTLLTLQLPALLEKAGVNVRVLDGWEDAHYSGRYKWREKDGNPAGHMHHHTAGSRYRPNRDKASGYAGLSYRGSETLYQERYEGQGYEAVYTIANAHPAPISSGAGDLNVLKKVRAGTEVRGRQGADTKDWYGNTHYWNTEYVLNGIGAPLDPEVWEMMVLVCQVQNQLHGWTPFNHIAHAMHTRRKVDLWDGSKSSSNRDGFDLTMAALRQDMAGDAPPIKPPIEPPTGDEMYIEVKKGDGYRATPEMKPAVAGWQGTIKLLGNPDGNSGSADGIDGVFGSGTEAATKLTQADIGVPVTGVADHATRAAAERHLIK